MIFNYKGYVGEATFDGEEKMFVGRVINLCEDGIVFSGETADESEIDFRGAVDDFQAWAAEIGFKPEKLSQGD